jgi:hypothetical protein
LNTPFAFGSRHFEFAELPDPGRAKLAVTDPFPCLVWDTRGEWTDAQRDALCEQLVAAGCRYLVCGGESCEKWHDWMDQAFLELELKYGEGAVPFVMTTWHDGEAMEEVAFFLFSCTDFEEHEFMRYLILVLGESPEESRRLRRALEFEALRSLVSNNESD